MLSMNKTASLCTSFTVENYYCAANVSLGRVCLKSAECNLIWNLKQKKTLKSDLIVGTPHILETEYALFYLF